MSDRQDDRAAFNAHLEALLRQQRYEEAFRAIIEALGPGVHGYLRAAAGSEAHGDDLYAALREALWQHLPQIKLITEDGQPGSIKAWLYRSARNRVLDFRQRYSRDHVRPMPTGQDFILRSPGPASILERKEEAARIARLMEQLTEEEHDALILHYERELSFREVGEVLGVSAAAAKQSCHRARQRLRDLLAQEQEPDA